MKPEAVIAEIIRWTEMAVRIALLLLIVAAVLGEFGVRSVPLPRIAPQNLAFLCGAWWLYRGGKL